MNKKKRMTSVLYLCAIVFFGYFLIINVHTINLQVNSLDTYGEAVLATRNIQSLETDYDNEIPFRPSMIVFYLSWMVLVFLPLFFISKDEEFNHTVYSYFFIIGLSILATLVYPVAPPREQVEDLTSTSKALIWLQENKPPINALPSFAISLSILSGFIVSHLNRRWGWIVLAYSLLVASSALFIKEATLANAGIGIVLAGLSYYLFIVKRGLE